ncbi:hypothetical protein IGI04_012053 [Brassica rapa subsp. trilocularis]|uniref:DUF4005 domain-containing protein n=1 Tax=Brassica rapa subsp. trilocularis TaxID=1813537 RepID=A0ABQ7N4V8_BRACM|nr:hypothetical protein IGI04_012053 [Brassica rapa subsp. trilocularis]
MHTHDYLIGVMSNLARKAQARHRRRADTRYGTDDALTRNQHREPTIGSPGTPEFTDSTPSPPLTVFDRSEPKNGEYHSTNRDLIRRQSSQSPRGRHLWGPSPLTLIKLRSSSDVVTTKPHKPTPTTAELNVASTSWGPEPAMTELMEPPPPGDKTKQPQKALHRTFLTTTAPLQQNQIHETTFFHSSGKAEEGGDVSKAKIKDFFGGFRGSGDGTRAHAPAVHRTRRWICFSSLSSLSSFLNHFYEFY